MKEIAQGFMDLYSGLSRAYGTFEINKTRARDNKQTGKVTSVQKEVTLDVWIQHLKGSQSIGIVPIRDDSTVVFGAIDIDVYDLDHKALVQKINLAKLPLTVTRTKSGGAHAWIFLSEPTPAELVQRKLREMAAFLGHGRAEIFPKQTEVLPERGDIGSWINMPYFNGVSGGRFGFKSDGTPLGPGEFLIEVKGRKTTAEQLENFSATVKEEFSDGPPCLQHIAGQQFPAGTRNTGLYNLGVYAKKSSPDSWEKMLEQFNVKYLDPPLGTNEVKELIKSLKKKDYQYTCSQVPLVSHCNAAKCRSRRYGVGDHSGMPTITGLTKFNSCPPIWFADIEGGGRLELSTDDLQSQTRFQKRCMESLNSMPSQMNQRAWTVMIQGLLENVSIIEAPDDATPRGQLTEMIEKYCTQRAQAMSKDEIRLGKPFTDGGRHYFTVSGLLAFLERHKFKSFSLSEITSFLKNDLGATHHFANLKGKGVNFWAIAEFALNPELDTPKDIVGKEVY